MRPSPTVRVHLCRDPVDFRKAINGLSIVVAEELELDPFSAHVFGFCNRRRDRLKLLLWDRSGFWVFAKRLEQGTFAWPRGGSDHDALQITMKELMCALEGIDLRDARMRKRMKRVPA